MKGAFAKAKLIKNQYCELVMYSTVMVGARVGEKGKTRRRLLQMVHPLARI